MKCLNYCFLFSLCLFPLSCTKKVQPVFEWKNLVNEEITKVKLEARRSIVEDLEVLGGQTESGLAIRVIERPKGGIAFDGLFERMGLLLDNLYEEQLAPYPGQVTKSIICPAEFRPRALPGKEDSVSRKRGFLLKANSRETFGACDAGSAHFQAAYLLIGCKAKGVAYEIKMFLPAGEKSAGELERIYGQFSCK